MKTTIKQKSDNQVTFTVQLDEAALAPFVSTTYDRLRGNLKVAGFRPGKAPNAIVERELGAGAVQSEVLDAATSHSYAHAVREHQLPVVAAPEVKLTKFVPYTELEYEATAELLPPIKLADYKHLKVKRLEVKVEAAEIDQVIEDLRKRLAQRRDADRAAKLGDEVVIDFAGSKNGQPVAGATSKNYPLLLGSKAFIPGFEEELVGLKAGDDKSFDITFPKDYGEPNLANQKVTFAIKLHRVVEVELPKVDGKLAAEVGPYKTVAELRQAIEANIKSQHQQEADRSFEQALLTELQQQSKLKLPQKLIDSQVEKMRQDLQSNLEQRGQTMAEYAASQNTTEAEINQQIVPEATRRVELALILTEVAKAEGVEVNNQDIDQQLEQLRGQYQDAEMRRELDRPETREEIYNHLMAQRTIDKIKDYNEGK